MQLTEIQVEIKNIILDLIKLSVNETLVSRKEYDLDLDIDKSGFTLYVYADDLGITKEEGYSKTSKGMKPTDELVWIVECIEKINK
jgi:tRNA U34 5-carboxymethylaminomethyl modifying enzyme MnmG/GidA